MNKKLLALFMAVFFSITGIGTNNICAFAEEQGEDVMLSEVLTEDALVGYSESQTWGVYLAQGVSFINNAGGGKIGCGGITEAAVKCKVTVNAIVEKKVNGSWTRVTSWTATNASAYTAAISKTLSVASGYYYRVRSIHYANTDASSSYTSALWM